eukprot:gnl/TRDRNA2_/TRDRNA2_60861_c0_seq1.p1 gnl/TRDRNA2_/TRDRNA2_60861_c0~~gnl/TRDRNA2_/TRDRNA2_60861_c0_seq1.p1  ORF type:complete len:260 (-),score=14.36 gnl/TRDRNA2_/TRDRNA2_60861_c0_seq1:255-1034(-)
MDWQEALHLEYASYSWHGCGLGVFALLHFALSIWMLVSVINDTTDTGPGAVMGIGFFGISCSLLCCASFCCDQSRSRKRSSGGGCMGAMGMGMEWLVIVPMFGCYAVFFVLAVIGMVMETHRTGISLTGTTAEGDHDESLLIVPLSMFSLAGSVLWPGLVCTLVAACGPALVSAFRIRQVRTQPPTRRQVDTQPPARGEVGTLPITTSPYPQGEHVQGGAWQVVAGSPDIRTHVVTGVPVSIGVGTGESPSSKCAGSPV